MAHVLQHSVAVPCHIAAVESTFLGNDSQAQFSLRSQWLDCRRAKSNYLDSRNYELRKVCLGNLCKTKVSCQNSPKTSSLATHPPSPCSLSSNLPSPLRYSKSHGARDSTFQVPSAQKSYVTTGIPVLPPAPEYVMKVRTIILQAFNWKSAEQYPWWEHLMGKVDDIASSGITAVWLPPVSQSADRQGYLPGRLYDLDDSSYGTKAQLVALIRAFTRRYVRCIADIVINHRSATSQDEHGHWNIFKGGTPGPELDWGRWAIVQEDYDNFEGEGGHDTGANYNAAPDIDHTNRRVQRELIQWLTWLRDDIGFSGWRLDFAKGYSPAFAALYIDASRPTGAVGELWSPLIYDGDTPAYDQNRHRQELCDWIDATGGRASAFDFTTKGILQHALLKTELWRLRDPDGRASGLIGWYPERATTFIENHDTGSTQGHWPFPGDRVMQGYAYILTHPGVPCIFYDHFFEWGLKDEITALIDVRRRNGIHAASKLEILCAEADMYVARIDDRVTLKMGPRFDMGGLLPSPDTSKLACSGMDYAVWETLAVPVVPFPFGFSMETTTLGQYCRQFPEDVLEGIDACLLDGGKQISPRQLAASRDVADTNLVEEESSEDERLAEDWWFQNAETKKKTQKIGVRTRGGSGTRAGRGQRGKRGPGTRQTVGLRDGKGMKR